MNDKNWIDLDGLLEQIARRTVPVDSILPPSQSSVASSSPARSIEDSGFFEQDREEEEEHCREESEDQSEQEREEEAEAEAEDDEEMSVEDIDQEL